MSNGCGCEKGLLRYIKPPYAAFFYTACVCHDDDYDKGGDGRQRKKADRNLYWRMVTLVKKHSDFSPLTATRMIAVALLYYYSVRLFGWMYFNYIKQKQQ